MLHLKAHRYDFYTRIRQKSSVISMLSSSSLAQSQLKRENMLMRQTVAITVGLSFYEVGSLLMRTFPVSLIQRKIYKMLRFKIVVSKFFGNSYRNLDYSSFWKLTCFLLKNYESFSKTEFNLNISTGRFWATFRFFKLKVNLFLKIVNVFLDDYFNFQKKLRHDAEKNKFIAHLCSLFVLFPQRIMRSRHQSRNAWAT